jgi:hypothetical protein
MVLAIPESRSRFRAASSDAFIFSSYGGQSELDFRLGRRQLKGDGRELGNRAIALQGSNQRMAFQQRKLGLLRLFLAEPAEVAQTPLPLLCRRPAGFF